jgi:hypothetical protein
VLPVTPSVDFPYLAEISATRQYQCLAQVRLDPEEEEALAAASLNDIMALADILNTNPQEYYLISLYSPFKMARSVRSTYSKYTLHCKLRITHNAAEFSFVFI